MTAQYSSLRICKEENSLSNKQRINNERWIGSELSIKYYNPHPIILTLADY